MRAYLRIARSEPAARAQVRVWAVVAEADGVATEEVLVKVPEGADEDAVRAAVERLLAGDEDAQLAALQAELELLQARLGALIGAEDLDAPVP